MGFLDSSSSIVTAILTRKGRELLAKNDGSFRIAKFAFGDDEINYQLYNAATDNDADILNLPVLEPSSNEITALRYRLITGQQGIIQVAYLVSSVSFLTLQNQTVQNGRTSSVGAISVGTRNGVDTAYIAQSRQPSIATVLGVGEVHLETVNTDLELGQSEAHIVVRAGVQDGTTYIDIVGRDTGATISIPVVTVSNTTT